MSAPNVGTEVLAKSGSYSGLGEWRESKRAKGREYVRKVSRHLCRPDEKLRGGITSDEGALLMRLVSEARDGCIVEVGSFRGKSAVALAIGVRKQHAGFRPQIFCIEPHSSFTGYYGLHKTIAGELHG